MNAKENALRAGTRQGGKSKAVGTDSATENVAANRAEWQWLLKAGLKLIKLKPYSKAPEGLNWNAPSNYINGAGLPAELTGVGLPLAANQLASIDPDQKDLAAQGLHALDLDLDGLMSAGARTVSTRPGSGGRSTFKLKPSQYGKLKRLVFGSVEHGIALELRAGDYQDCVPGTVYRTKHPDGPVYRQSYDPLTAYTLQKAPPLPAKLAEFWERCVSEPDFYNKQRRLFAEAIGGTVHTAMAFGAAKLAHASPCRMEYLRLAAEGKAPTVEALLKKHGYTYDEQSKRWAHPKATGLPGIAPLPGKEGAEGLWFSHHAGDPLSGCFDAWNAFVMLEHGDDQLAAEVAFRELVQPALQEAAQAEFDALPEEPKAAVAPLKLHELSRDGAAQYAPVRIALPKFLAEGLTLLNGAKKVSRKTWTMLMLAVRLGNGLDVWRERPPSPLRVAVLALEEGGTVMGKNGEPLPALDAIYERLRLMRLFDLAIGKVRIATELLPMDEGGLAQLDQLAAAHDVVFIDSRAVLRGTQRTKPGEDAWTKDYNALRPLQALARRHHCCIVLLNHLSKGADFRDAIDAGNSTGGTDAAVDGLWVLQFPDKDQKERCRLTVHHRRMDRGEYELRWDNLRKAYDMLGEWTHVTGKHAEVLSALIDAPAAMRVEEVAAAVGVTDRRNAQRYLDDLVKDKLVFRSAPRGPAPAHRPAYLYRPTELAYRWRGEEAPPDADPLFA